MKNKKHIAKAVGISSMASLALVLMSGCVVEPDGRIQAGVEVFPPVVAVEADVVPDDYYWDGYEYVGIVGDRYYYLGPGNVWVVCDPIRLHRFNVWIGAHPDWRVHATVNVHYRTDAHGHYQDRHDSWHEKKGGHHDD